MAVNGSVQVDRRVLIAQLSAAEPVLVRVATEVMRKSFFDPAVQKLKEDFEKHPVTNEIAGGAGAPNVSETLEGSFRDKDGDTPPNLWGFIGFEKSALTPETALAPIAKRLDPSHADGPKMVYKEKDKDNLIFNYEIRAPSKKAILDDKDTHFDWLPGISWVSRIEKGIPGITHFLNSNRAASRSSGGIQVEGNVRSGRFRPVSYLSEMFNNFLRRAVGRKDNGRVI